MGLESSKGKKIPRPLSKLPAHVRKAVLDPDANRDLLRRMQVKATETRVRNVSNRKAADEYWDEKATEKAQQDELKRQESTNEHILPIDPEQV